MKDIRLGAVTFNPAELASQGNAILGIRDSGKSYTATWLAEQLLDAGIPIVAFDPIGIWRFLRVPGAGAGYQVVVAGGEHGDLPLTPQSAAEIVRAAMRENVSLVIDLYSMELSKADWKRIVEACVRVLLYENRAHGLRHIFIEEAAEFCPQRVGPDQGRVYAEIEKLARMGGNALLGYTLINQRAEEVNKAVLELCDCLFLHRQKGRNSLTALSKWLDIADAKGAKGIMQSLPQLTQGQCWIWAAGTDRPTLVKVPTKRSFHPNRRLTRAQLSERQAVPIDVGAFVQSLKTSLEAHLAEAAANDPAALKAEMSRLHARIEELEAQSPVSDPVVDQTALEAAKLEGYAEGHDAALGIGRHAISAIREALAAFANSVDLASTSFHSGASTASNFLATRPPFPDAAVPPTQPRSASPARSPEVVSGSTRQVKLPPPAPGRVDERGRGNGAGAPLPKAERLILTALAQYPGGRTHTQVAILTGYAANGGGFRNAVGALRGRGCLAGGSDRLQITPAGVKALGRFDPLPRGRALLQHWLGQLPKAERKALEELASVYPRTLSTEQLASRSGYEANGGGFRNALGKLRTLELIRGRGELKASEDLFG